jgi:hypothetical protein
MHSKTKACGGIVSEQLCLERRNKQAAEVDG